MPIYGQKKPEYSTFSKQIPVVEHVHHTLPCQLEIENSESQRLARKSFKGGGGWGEANRTLFPLFFLLFFFFNFRGDKSGSGVVPPAPVTESQTKRCRFHLIDEGR